MNLFVVVIVMGCHWTLQVKIKTIFNLINTRAKTFIYKTLKLDKELIILGIFLISSFNNSVFLSEKDTADRNFALAYYMKENKCFPKGFVLQDCLDFYFQVIKLISNNNSNFRFEKDKQVYD